MPQVTETDVLRDSLLGEILALTARIDRCVDADEWDDVGNMVKSRQRAMERLFSCIDAAHPMSGKERSQLSDVLDSMQQNLNCIELARESAIDGIRRHRSRQSAVLAYASG
jgi:predicted AlkP superfamily phosphohydrolase/phosphomutase